MKLLDFDLEIALKQPERVVYSDGEKPLDWKYFDKGITTYLIVTIDKKGDFATFTKTGEINQYSFYQKNLKLLPETKTYWYCLFKCERYTILHTSEVFSNKGDFLENNRYLGDIKILQEHTYTETI